MLTNADSLARAEGEIAVRINFRWVHFAPSVRVELKGILVKLFFEVVGFNLEGYDQPFFDWDLSNVMILQGQARE